MDKTQYFATQYSAYHTLGDERRQVYLSISRLPDCPCYRLAGIGRVLARGQQSRGGGGGSGGCLKEAAKSGCIESRNLPLEEQND
jgi:hypothetical protein